MKSVQDNCAKEGIEIKNCIEYRFGQPVENFVTINADVRLLQQKSQVRKNIMAIKKVIPTSITSDDIEVQNRFYISYAKLY